MEEKRVNDPSPARPPDAPMRRTNDTAPPPRTETPVSRTGDFGLVDRGSTAEFDRRWRAVQGEFVEDPRRAVSQARALLAELLDHVSKNLRQDRQDGDGRGAGDGDTEAMRLELRRYRDVIQRLLGEDTNVTPAPPAPRPQGAPRIAD